VIDGRPVDVAACGEIAAFYRAEIERIITHCDPWDPPQPPAT
jgi:hypothetical protein